MTFLLTAQTYNQQTTNQQSFKPLTMDLLFSDAVLDLESDAMDLLFSDVVLDLESGADDEEKMNDLFEEKRVFDFNRYFIPNLKKQSYDMDPVRIALIEVITPDLTNIVMDYAKFEQSQFDYVIMQLGESKYSSSFCLSFDEKGNIRVHDPETREIYPLLNNNILQTCLHLTDAFEYLYDVFKMLNTFQNTKDNINEEKFKQYVCNAIRPLFKPVHDVYSIKLKIDHARFQIFEKKLLYMLDFTPPVRVPNSLVADLF